MTNDPKPPIAVLAAEISVSDRHRDHQSSHREPQAGESHHSGSGGSGSTGSQRSVEASRYLLARSFSRSAIRRKQAASA
jgi:hypothetical protein